MVLGKSDYDYNILILKHIFHTYQEHFHSKCFAIYSSGWFCIYIDQVIWYHVVSLCLNELNLPNVEGLKAQMMTSIESAFQ